MHHLEEAIEKMNNCIFFENNLVFFSIYLYEAKCADFKAGGKKIVQYCCVLLLQHSKADAKRTQSYFLGPSYLGLII